MNRLSRYLPLLMTFAVAALLLVPRPTHASAPPAAQAVLAQEERWLAAIVAGDTKTAASILSETPEFAHITAAGKLLHRAQELANMKKESFTMNPTEQTVDFTGDAAIVRGINTLVQAGKTIARERFTDVFINRNGTWLAISAQETNIEP
jgi:Domain of unknown function (DUF4440)